jgi:hypothetical protein
VNIATNTDKYYVLQHLIDTASDEPNHYVFTRWGRTGQVALCVVFCNRRVRVHGRAGN